MRAGVAIFLMLSGCATEGSLRDSSVYFSAATSKPSKQVADCILSSWAGEKFLTVRRTEAAGRITIIASFGSLAGEDMIADVSEKHVALHRRPAIWSGVDVRLRDEAAQCAAL